MEYVVIFVVAFLAGLIGAGIVAHNGIRGELRFWRSFGEDLYYHGLDNHFCTRAGCCR